MTGRFWVCTWLILSCAEVPQEPAPQDAPWSEVQGGTKGIVAGRACAGGEAEACVWLGTESRWRHGNPDLALAAWSRGCVLGQGESCVWAGHLLWWSPDHPQDLDTARTLLDRGCTLGSAAGCSGRADLDRVLAASKACRSPSVSQCSEACLGGVRDACDLAEEGMRARCVDGEAEACTWLGDQLAAGRISGDPAEGDLLLWRGCDLDDPWACLRLADRVARGDAQNPSPKSLDWLYIQGCDLQLDYACVSHPTAWPSP